MRVASSRRENVHIIGILRMYPHAKNENTKSDYEHARNSNFSGILATTLEETRLDT